MTQKCFTLDKKGLRDLEDVLRKLSDPRKQKAALKEALIKSAKPVAEMAKSLAPEDEGTLKASIGAGASLTERGKKVGRYENDKGYKINAYVGARDSGRGKRKGAPHAHLVEFGTGPRVQKSTGRKVGAAPPQPFMRPAWDAEGPQILDRLSPLVFAVVERMLKGGGRGRPKKG